MVKLPKFDKIEYLIGRKFGPLGVRQARKSPEQSRQISDYRDLLLKLPQEEIDVRVEKERIKNQEEIAAKAERDEQARFFNQPFAAADFEHWSKAAHWSLDEAIALSFGKEPEHVNWQKVKTYIQVSPFAYQYQRRRDLAIRALPWKQLFDPVLPTIFLDWARRNELDVPTELEDAVASRGQQIADWKTLHDEQKARAEAAETDFAEALVKLTELKQTPAAKELSTKERESLLKLVIGMAVDGYGYDPQAARSPIPKEIADQLAARGLQLDKDTVRKYMKEAAEILPRQSDDDT